MESETLRASFIELLDNHGDGRKEQFTNVVDEGEHGSVGNDGSCSTDYPD